MDIWAPAPPPDLIAYVSPPLLEAVQYLKFKLKINNINYMVIIVILSLNTFTAVLSVFSNNFLISFFVFVSTSYSDFNNDLP